MRVAASLVAVIALATTAPAPASLSPVRLFMLGSSEDPTAWFSTSSEDPELQGDWSCSTATILPEGEGRCRGGLNPLSRNHEYLAAFYPQVRIGQPITWGPENPLSLHAEVSAEAPLGFTVELGAMIGGDAATAAATEIAPGVFEASLTRAGSFQPASMVPLFVVVKSIGEVSSITIKGHGRSWAEVSTSVAVRSVPELMELDSSGPVTNNLTTAARRYEFSDSNWSHQTFSGTLIPTSTHTIEVPTHASILFAWIEGFDDPVVSQALRGETPDVTRLLQYPRIRILRGTEQLISAERTTALMDVKTGTLSIEVSASAPIGALRSATSGLPFTLHVLQVLGPKTLKTMRWEMPPARWNSFNVPMAASCPYPQEPIPQLADVESFRVDLQTHASTPGQKWTLFFELPGVGLFPCGEMQTEDSVRFTIDGTRMWYIGPTPHSNTWFHSVQDVTFTMEVSYVYAP